MNKEYYLEKVNTIKSNISELRSHLRQLEQECLLNCAKYKVGEAVKLNFDYENFEITVTIISTHIDNNLDIRYLVKVADTIDTLLFYEDYIDDKKIII